MVTLDPLGKHSASFVLIHGLGDSAYGWLDVAEHLSTLHPHVKFILPTASEKPVTLNGGMEMPSWYDIKGLETRASETCDGIDESKQYITSLIENENKNGIPYKRIILGGFSQGGALSLFTSLQIDQTLAGVKQNTIKTTTTTIEITLPL